MAFVDTQTTTAAKFCLFSCRVATKPKTVVIFGTCTSRTLLLAIHNDTIPKTNRTDAGRPSLWQHLAGLQKSDCIRIESTFSRLMGRQEYRLAWALVRRTFWLDHSTVHNHRHSIQHTTYTHTAYKHHVIVNVKERYETNIDEYRLVLLLSFLNCVSYVCQSLSNTFYFVAAISNFLMDCIV